MALLSALTLLQLLDAVHVLLLLLLLGVYQLLVCFDEVFFDSLSSNSIWIVALGDLGIRMLLLIITSANSAVSAIYCYSCLPVALRYLHLYASICIEQN